MVQKTYHTLSSPEHLNVLIGVWNLEFIFANDPEHHLHGREDFEWMKDRRSYSRGGMSPTPTLYRKSLHVRIKA
jgi:hypothetical protein